VDELYEAIILKPFRWIGQGVFVAVDRFIIDLLIVEGSAFIIDTIGRALRWFQNGQIQRYIVALLIGTALVFFFATRPSTDFSWTKTGPLTVRFMADVGDGPAGAGAEIAWDFDGDGKTDSTKAELTHRFKASGTHKVTLRVTSGPFRTETTVTRTVKLDAPNSGQAPNPGKAQGGGK
jgi:PKD repeat protein